MPIYRWLCPKCHSAYILPRHSKHRHNHWRCYSCSSVFSRPYEAGTMMWDDHFEAPLKAKKPSNWSDIVKNYSGPYRFPADMMLYSDQPQPKRQDSRSKSKRDRATALVINEGKLLLIRERGAKHWSLPGGGMERGESPVTGACREVDEETKLQVSEAAFLFNYESRSQHHHVCLLQANGKVHLQRKEVSDYRWWDGKAQLPIIDSATAIIERARDRGYLAAG